MTAMEGIETIIDGIKTAMVADCRNDIGEMTAEADIAENYMEAMAEKIVEEIDRYTKAFSDFKK